jgi:hypothetical protein
MTNRLSNDELDEMIRMALPEVDADLLSPTGAQARAVMNRLNSNPPPSVQDSPEAVRFPRRAQRLARLDFVVSLGVLAVAAAAILSS